ncbi:MAG TPA: EamA family transporter [Candidatus Limnocylindrales bacterium]|nr:EamA family transporter [Candidatus Limnocylindrales bacterium]
MAGLLAALTWGAADFGGGLTSRRAPALAVVLGSQLIAGLIAAGIAVARGEALLDGGDVAWAAGAGAVGAVALAAFYHGLATGRMGVVAPIAGVIAAAVPVAAGMLLEGLPATGPFVGMIAAVVAIFLVSWTSGRAVDAGPQRRSVLLATAAGCGFGLFYVLLDRVEGDAVFWPLVVARMASVSLMIAVVATIRVPVRSLGGVAPALVVVGVLDLAGNAFFRLGALAGRLDVASVLSSLYPIATVALAALVLRERVSPLQAAGIGIAGLAIALIAGG